MQGFYGDSASEMRVAAPPVDGRAYPDTIRSATRRVEVCPVGFSKICSVNGRAKTVREANPDAATVSAGRAAG